MSKFVFYKQPDLMDCGPTCLRMVAKYYGKSFTTQTLRKISGITKDGVSLLGISEAAEKIGFRTLGAKLAIEQLAEVKLPIILYWQQNHFVVLYKIAKNKFFLADPRSGLIQLTSKDFWESWSNKGSDNFGIGLLLTPTNEFYQQESEKEKKISWSLIFRYIIQYRSLLLQLVLGLAIGSVMQLIIPFLTQSIIDIGVNGRNVHFIAIILAAQLTLLIGRVSADYIRSWILLHISTRVNISLLTDFLIKLMKLPISFFDIKVTGDIMQRMGDQQKIESFLTGSALNTFFSLLNFILFSFVLFYYNSFIFLVFLGSNIFYFAWISIFMRYRRILNYKNFEVSAKNQNSIIQMIGGMQELKLNNCEQQKRWEWEHIQARLFKFSVKNLALSQYQQGGATFINEGSTLLITFLSAKAVIDGHLTLGGMLAIQYIISQLNNPIQQFVSFIQSYQDARISLERLNEIHQMDDEEPVTKHVNQTMPTNKNVTIRGLTFRYPGAGNDPVLRNIDLNLPHGKTTAVVGMSGSGKTTLLKLLLRFHVPEKGDIRIGGNLLDNLSYKMWRQECGVVMQDGFIFSDTIERNIAVGDEEANPEKLAHAIHIANIGQFIDELPMGLQTRIGATGNGVSQGQKQRILIARAVYKDPQFIFFDEATNALDANNERVILENLDEFFSGRTVVVVAHRLSTVRNADNIVVFDKGQIVEQGTHEELIKIQGHYYQLIKNQLELGI